MSKLSEAILISKVAMHTLALMNFHFHKHKSMSYNTFWKIQKEGLEDIKKELNR